MFSGIIEKRSKVLRLAPHRGGRRLTIQAPKGWERLALGASVAVDGACLTVAARGRGTLSFDLLKETLRRTRFASLKPGDRVNLERALKAGGRFEGHFVQGHVDGVGVVSDVEAGARERTVRLTFPKELSPYLIPKGSIALNGVSLTIGGRGGSLIRPYAGFNVHLIPFTLKKTNLGLLKKGDKVNLEADALLKFFRRLTRRKGHYKLMPSTLAARKWHETI